MSYIPLYALPTSRSAPAGTSAAHGAAMARAQAARALIRAAVESRQGANGRPAADGDGGGSGGGGAGNEEGAAPPQQPAGVRISRINIENSRFPMMLGHTGPTAITLHIGTSESICGAQLPRGWLLLPVVSVVVHLFAVS